MKTFLKELGIVFVLFFSIAVSSVACFIVFSGGDKIGNSVICFGATVLIYGFLVGFKLEKAEEDRKKIVLKPGLRISVLTLAYYMCLMAINFSLGFRKAVILFLVILLSMEFVLYIGVIVGLFLRHASRSKVDRKKI